MMPTNSRDVTDETQYSSFDPKDFWAMRSGRVIIICSTQAHGMAWHGMNGWMDGSRHSQQSKSRNGRDRGRVVSQSSPNGKLPLDRSAIFARADWLARAKGREYVPDAEVLSIACFKLSCSAKQPTNSWQRGPVARHCTAIVHLLGLRGASGALLDWRSRCVRMQIVVHSSRLPSDYEI